MNRVGKARDYRRYVLVADKPLIEGNGYPTLKEAREARASIAKQRGIPSCHIGIWDTLERISK